ncbi:MAG: hypothetical protein ACJ76Y_27580 [Thermoanaerobaculia bacterium]
MLYFIPQGEAVARGYAGLWEAVVPWVGRHLFGVEAHTHLSGSGDKMFDWVQVFCFLALALAATVVWTLLDRRRTHYERLYEWLRVYVRFGLAVVMIEYGGLKVVPSQFPRPSLYRLAQPFGDASPMGMLWTFMGASAPYTSFAGLTEWLGGVLLVFRRTAPLGALVSMAAMANVVMLNFCYDVPVKLFSSHLLAMAVFLAAPHLRRLAGLLVLNRPVSPAPEPRLIRGRRLRRGVLVFQVLFAAGYSIYMMYTARKDLAEYYGDRSPLQGIWKVEALQADGREGPPPGAEALQWSRVVFGDSNVVAIRLASGSRRYGVELDPAHGTLALTRRGDPAWKALLAYQRPAPDRLTLAGTFDGHAVRASLHRIDESELPLLGRGFHWVSEYPFNR